MSENRYRARAMELGIKVEALTQENEHLKSTAAMFEGELAAAEDAATAMERDRDELLETVNRHALEPVGDLEQQIRWLKQRIAAKDEDFDFTSALADGYKAQRDAARAERNGAEPDPDVEIVDLTIEEAQTAVDAGEDIVPFHRDASGKLVANGSVGIDFPNLRPEERTHISNLNADFRQAIEERDEARRVRDQYRDRLNTLNAEPAHGLIADHRQAIEERDMARDAVLIIRRARDGDAAISATLKEERDGARKDLTAYQLRTVVLEEALARADADLKSIKEGVAGGNVDTFTGLKLEVSDLEALHREQDDEINDLVHVIADNAEKENRAATEITNLRKNTADLTIRVDELTFERDRLHAEVESLTVQKAALTTDPSRIAALEKQLDEARRERDMAQLDRHNLTEKLKYWDNVAPNTAPELIVSTLMEERDGARAERDAAEHDAATLRDEYAVEYRTWAGRADEAEAGRVARNERETARRERDVAREELRLSERAEHHARMGRDEALEELASMTESVRFNVERVTELAEELSDVKADLTTARSNRGAIIETLTEELDEVKAQRNDKDVIIDAMLAEQKQHGVPREQREWRQRVEGELDEANRIHLEEREVSDGKIVELTRRIATLDADAIESDDLIARCGVDLDRLGEENTTLALRLEDAATTRKLGEEKVENLTNLLAATDAKVAALRADAADNAQSPAQSCRKAIEERDEAERRVEELTCETDTLTAALELAEEKLGSTETALTMALKKLATLDGPNKPTTPGATTRDKFPPGIGDCRLGYDYGEEIFFDRTKPVEGEQHADGGPMYEECEPTDVVAELETERDALQILLEKQTTKTADRLAEQRLLQRELRTVTTRMDDAIRERGEARAELAETEQAREDAQTWGNVKLEQRNEASISYIEETKKNATLRKRLHQAIKHIDDMTGALIGGGPFPTRPECLPGGSENNPPPSESPTPSPEALMKIERHFFEKAAHRPMTAKEEETLRRKYSVEAASLDLGATASPGGPTRPDVALGPKQEMVLRRGRELHEAAKRKRVVATAMGLLRRAKSRWSSTPAASEAPDRLSPDVGSCLCGAGGLAPHVPASVRGCAHLYVEPCDEIVKPPAQTVQVEAASMFGGPESPADDDETVSMGGLGAFASVSVVDAAAESDANASACISVWLAPSIPCPATSDGSHGYSNPATREGHTPLPPFCPQCHESFTMGPRPEDENAAYVIPKEARRMTGS